jgi:hypothetical protein
VAAEPCFGEQHVCHRLTSRAFAAIERQREFTALQGGEMSMEPGFNRPWRDDRR